MKFKTALATLAITTIAVAAFLAALAQPLAAASPNNDIITIVPPARASLSRSPSAIALMQPADYVCAIVEITSTGKKSTDLAAQINDVRRTTRLIAQAVEKTPSLSMHDGPVRFSANEQNLFAGSPATISTVASNVASFVSGDSPTIVTQTLRILYKLAVGQEDTLDATLALHTLVNGIQPPSGTKVRINAIALAVNAPERQREQLLRLVRNGAEAMGKTFSTSRLTIAGLENPVLVRQVSDTQVELYIDYTLTVTTGQ
jgi:hypothetical protein